MVTRIIVASALALILGGSRPAPRRIGRGSGHYSGENRGVRRRARRECVFGSQKRGAAESRWANRGPARV
jgi:hypothetical protein